MENLLRFRLKCRVANDRWAECAISELLGMELQKKLKSSGKINRIVNFEAHLIYVA